MTDGLSKVQGSVLAWVFSALLIILTTIVSWICLTIQDMPHEFVRLERYLADNSKVEKSLIRMECQSEKGFARLEKALEGIQKELRK